MTWRESSFYTGLITGRHRAFAPDFVATVDFCVRGPIGLADFLASIPEAFDVDEAVGVQLDVDGRWIGRSRIIDVPLPNLWFSWGDPARGWGRGVWRQPFDPGTGQHLLDDETYRRLLYAKIDANSWDGTSPSAYDIMTKFFGPSLPAATRLFVQENDDKTIVFGISGEVPDPLLMSLWANDYVPLKAAGNRSYHYVTSINHTPLFGWGMDNDYVGGWGRGSWGVSPDYFVQHPIA